MCVCVCLCVCVCVCGFKLIRTGLNENTVTLFPCNRIVNIFQIFSFLQKFLKYVCNTVAVVFIFFDRIYIRRIECYVDQKIK